MGAIFTAIAMLCVVASFAGVVVGDQIFARFGADGLISAWWIIAAICGAAGGVAFTSKESLTRNDDLAPPVLFAAGFLLCGAFGFAVPFVVLFVAAVSTVYLPLAALWGVVWMARQVATR